MFPLRMTSIEKLHFFDDSPEYPNQFFARLRLEGEVNRDQLNEAYRRAVARHVRGRAIVQSVAGRWQWVESPDPPEDLRFRETGAFCFDPIDLRRTPGYRTECLHQATHAEIMIQVHHALTDGLGGLAFVRDWLLIYNNLWEGKSPEVDLPPLDPRLLLQRNRIGLASRAYVKNLWRQPIALFGAAKFLGRKFQTLSPRPNPISRLNTPTFVSLDLPADQLHSLRQRLTRERISLNDFLLATLFATLPRFESSITTSRCWRIIVPISIRDRRDQALPVANRTTLVQLDRRSQETRNLLELSQGIHFELGVIQKWMLDRMFLLLVRGMSITDGWLARHVHGDRPRATTLLTNLGKPLARSRLPVRDGKIWVGGARIEEVDLLPPLRAHLPLSFAALQYGGGLRITGHVDQRHLARADAQAFLDIWRTQLESLL